MATKIGFKLQDKPVIADTSSLIDLSNTLLNQEKDRETQRQAWRDEQDTLRKTQDELTPTANQNANQFFGKFSQGIMDESIRLQKQLETGQINSSDYSAQWRNLNQTNEQMIAAQTSYQERAQQIADDVASGKSSAVNTADLNHFNKVFQPGAMEVEPDGRGGLKLFNKETNDVVSPSYLSNLTNGNLPKYDYSTIASTLAKQFGERGITDAAGNTIKGVYANMDPGKLDELMLKEAKALLAGSQAPTVSILVDGMGYDVVYNEDELKPGNVYRKPDGTFAFAEGDKEKAEVFMRDALKNALPLEEKERPDLTEKEKSDLKLSKERVRIQRGTLNQRIKEFLKGDLDKQEALDTQIEVIASLYGGTQEDINAAVDYYRDIGGNTNIQRVTRNNSGISVTFIDENGDTQTRPISFFVADETSDTLVPNPNFDSSKEESDANPKRVKGRQKSEAQFINSASQLLIGQGVNDRTNIKNEDDTPKFNRNLTSTEDIVSEVKVDKAEGEEDNSDFIVEIDKYLNEMFSTDNLQSTRPTPSDKGIDLEDEDTEVAEQINTIFKDLDIDAEAISTVNPSNDGLIIRIPGYNADPLLLDADFFTRSYAQDETEKLRKYIRTFLISKKGKVQTKNMG